MFDVRRRPGDRLPNVGPPGHTGDMAKPVRTERIAARVTPELRAAIERAAERDRRTVSDWISIVLEAAVASSETPPKAKR